jgi:hypothetical protein
MASGDLGTLFVPNEGVMGVKARVEYFQSSSQHQQGSHVMHLVRERVHTACDLELCLTQTGQKRNSLIGI